MRRILPLACLTLTSFAATTHRNIEYGRVGDVALLLDAHIPEGPGPHPAVILVHGGAWISGDRARNVAPLFEPLERAGFAWFSISYRLASDIMLLGTAIDDVQEAVRFVRSNAAQFRVDPNRIALAGESAGGQLASMVAARGAKDRSSAVNAVVALYTPSDLVSLAQSSPLVPGRLRDAVKGTPMESLLLGFLRTLSPAANVSSDMPPFLLIHGTADSLVPYAQSVSFCQKLQASGSTCELYAVTGGEHGMRSWRSLAANAYKDYMMQWLRSHLNVPAPKPPASVD